MPGSAADVPALLFPADWRTAAGTGVLALALYTATCCPGAHWGDSGELIAAGVTLGIAHPPGHPLYSLLAHLFTWVPFGALAWRVNWLSAVGGACAVAISFLLASECLSRVGVRSPWGRLGAGVGAAAFGLTVGLWGDSTVAETTSLHAVFMAAVTWLVWRIAWVQPTGSTLTRALGAAAALYGFSATNHVAGIFFLPAIAVLLVGRCGWRVVHPRQFACVLPAVAAGLTLYAYLPLRSSQEPWLDWGNPETLANFWWVVSAKQFQSMLVQPLGAAAALAALGGRGGLIANELTLPGLALALCGWLVLARRMPWHAAYILLALLALGGLGLSTSFIAAYFVPGSLLLAVTLAVGVGWLAERLPLHTRVLAVVGAAGLVAWSAVRHYPACARQHRDGAERYARSLLEPLPPNAILFTTNMNMLFASWAMQVGERVRPDVAVIDWRWAAGDSPLTAELRRDHPDVTFPSMAALEPYRDEWNVDRLTPDIGFAVMVEQNYGRRPMFLGPPGEPTRLEPQLRVWNGVFAIVKPPEPGFDPDAVETMRDHWAAWEALLEARPAMREPKLEEALVHDINNQGLVFERTGRTDLAAWNYDVAARLAPAQPVPWLNRGRLAAQRGDWQRAYDDFSRAVAAAPRNADAQYHLARALEGLGRFEDAYTTYLEAILWDPWHAPAHRRAGLLLLRAGQPEQAGRHLGEALRLDPQDAVAARGRVRAALAQGAYDDVAQGLRVAAALEPTDVELQVLRAGYAAMTGEPDTAARLLHAARQQDAARVEQLLRTETWAADLLPTEAHP